MSQCKKFAPNIFHKNKCSNCFRQKDEHSAEALECNRASRKVARSGYLFVAPDWDFSVPLNRTKRWQRRFFVLYDDGELNYSVDEHPDTVPQGSVDMSKVLEVTGAEQVTGHPHSLALTSPDRVTFVKAASREDARWWAELLAVFPRRHKRNATFPGGRASPSLPQLGRSASPQPPRPRHLSVTGPSPRTNFETPPLKEERESPPKDVERSGWMPERTNSLQIDSASTTPRNDYIVSSGSPPTRDKLRCDDKARARRDWRNERLRDIAAALTDRSPESSLALPSEGLLHLKKGWLRLKSGGGEWVKRWVVLCGPTLNVYQEQDEQSAPELVVEMSSVTSYNEVQTDSGYGFDINWGGPSLTLSAMTQGIRTNWLQALKKAAPIQAESPITPPTPRSVLLSSDEEYRTASEGGRRGSEDWSELPPSPPLSRLTLNKVKERTRLRPRLPRCQSRQSTLDSTSTDELDCAKEPQDLQMQNKQNNELNELQKQLNNALAEIQLLEEEIARLKTVQSEAIIREKKAKEEMVMTLERTERDLNQRNSQMELKLLKEQKALQRRLADAEESVKSAEDQCNLLTRDLQAKQRFIVNLQQELASSNDRLNRTRQENDRMYKKLQEIEGRYSFKQFGIKVQSLTDLTNIDLEVDLETMGNDELKEYCLDLKCRFERAIIEIRAIKKELSKSRENCDQLEIENYGLENTIEVLNAEHEADKKMLVAKIDHLTAKLNSVEKQLRAKTKSDSRDKRRSLSLKGRESFSINKEVEDKVTELEAKILAMEKGKARRKYKRDRSNERSSPIDDRALRRLRRKSLDSATSSEPMKLLMRLSTLENKVTNASNESLNLLSSSSVSDLTKVNEDSVDYKKLIGLAQLKVEECLSALKNSRRYSTSHMDKIVVLLNDLNDILCVHKVSTAEVEVINCSTTAVVKQLQSLLEEKLKSLAEKKRLLQEKNVLDASSRLEILAEKVAYENILVSRIQEALSAPSTGDTICNRLVNKETRETAHLIVALHNKLNGSGQKLQPSCRTSAEYLSKILSKCLISSAQGFQSLKCFVAKKTPSIGLLCEEQQKLEGLIKSYKQAKLPQLAEALATEAMNLASDKQCRLRSLNHEAIDNFQRAAREVVNSELIQSEINHVLLRAAQVYQANSDADHAFFFSFFASERAALELWSDSVGECLYREVNQCVEELTELYQNSLNKLQKQNWRRRVESERNTRTPSSMLVEFADVIAHKALIDARINVLSGKNTNYFVTEQSQHTETDNLHTWLDNDGYWSIIDQTMNVNQSIEAEFNCMIEKSSVECYAIVDKPEFEEVCGYLDEVGAKVIELQTHANISNQTSLDMEVHNWIDVCKKCRQLRDSLEDVRIALMRSGSFKKLERLDVERPVYLGTEYLTQVENLRAAYRCALASCKERHQETDIEQLQSLCEKVLSSMEQWHRRTIQDLREEHVREMEALKLDKEQALAEETQATLAALDAMRKAHQAEVQREVSKFKQEFARQQRDEIMDLKERLSVKSLEAAALEEQLSCATRQLAHLERNPQLSSLQN